MSAPWLKNEAKHILPKIAQIDLYHTFGDKRLNVELREEITRIKEHSHLDSSAKRIYELSDKITELKDKYPNGYSMYFGPSYWSQLWNELFILRSYYVSNHILTDNFVTFSRTILKGVEGLFTSYTTSELFNDRYKEFDEVVLSIILEYGSEKDLDKMINLSQIDQIGITFSSKEKVIKKIKNFFGFQYQIGPFNSLTFYDVLEKQNYYSRFRQYLRQCFNKVMTILTHADFNDNELELLSESIINYLQASDDFTNVSWKYFSRFLQKRIQIFNPIQIGIIIDHSLNGKNHRAGEKYLDSICRAASNKAAYIIDDETIFQKLINSAIEPCKKCNRIHNKKTIMSFWTIFDKQGKKQIENYMIKSLTDDFDAHLYQDAAFIGIFTKENQPVLFDKYLSYAVACCSPNDIKKVKGKWIYTSFLGVNALSCLNSMGIDFRDKQLSEIADKSEFYNWVINPEEYDYSNFDLKWLIDLCELPFLTKRLKGIDGLKSKVEIALKKKFDKQLSEFYTKQVLI